jgi:hypothetical protein
MLGARFRLSHPMAIVVLVALLLVPLALRGHRHVEHASTARPCASCVVANHSPAVSAPILAGLAPVLQGFTAAPSPDPSPACHERPAAAGRAPPALRLVA